MSNLSNREKYGDEPSSTFDKNTKRIGFPQNVDIGVTQDLRYRKISHAKHFIVVICGHFHVTVSIRNYNDLKCKDGGKELFTNSY